MKKVLHASDLFEEKKEEKTLKPIEFTHYLDSNRGWEKPIVKPSNYTKILYLGSDFQNGDMFAAYAESGETINIYKGHLNDGVIE